MKTSDKAADHPNRWRRRGRKLVKHGRRLWRRHWRLAAAWTVVGVIAVTVAVELLPSQAPSQTPTASASHAVIVGVPGLRWSDVDAKTTPTLYSLAERGSMGSLGVASAESTTCPLDGWLTLSAGAPASGDVRLDDDETCPSVSVDTVADDGDSGAEITRFSDLAAENRNQQSGAEVGALPSSVNCAAAVGPGAAYAAARPTGRVDRYEPELPDDPEALEELLSECPLSVVDMGQLPEGAGDRDAALQEIDASLAAVVEAMPEEALLLTAGISDISSAAQLHAVIAVGGGFDEEGWLTSAGTGREGFLRLIDLAPTAIGALDQPLPRPVVGVTAATLGGRGEDARAAITRLADDNAEAAAQEDAIMRFLFLVTIAMLALFVVSASLLQRIRRGTTAGKPATLWNFRAVVTASTGLALIIPAATLVDFVPWWRASHSMFALLAATAAIAVLLTALVFLAPKRRSSMGLMITVSLVGVTVVALDVLTGGRLQFDGISAYSALNSAGKAGLGPLGYGVFVTSLLTAAGCAAQVLNRRKRPVLIGLAGAVGVFIVGAPYLGDDPAGAAALTVGVCLAAAISTGGWLTFGRFAWALFAGVGLLVVLAISDVVRVEAARGPLGGFVADMFGGDSGGRIRATLEADVVAIGTNPLTLVVLASIVFTWVVLLRPSGGLKRAFGLYPSARAGFVGAITATLLGGLLGGQGFIPLGAAATITMPLAIITAQRVLARAHVRDGRSDPTDLEAPARVTVEDATSGVTVESRG